MIASTMSQMSDSVGSLMNGSITAELASGMKIMSDTLIAFQPRIELPSKMKPSVNDSSVSLWNGMRGVLPDGQANRRT